MLFVLANNSAMGVTTIAADIAIAVFIILRLIKLSDVFFILALVTKALTCHPQRFQSLLHNLHLQQCKSYTQLMMLE